MEDESNENQINEEVFLLMNVKDVYTTAIITTVNKVIVI